MASCGAATAAETAERGSKASEHSPADVEIPRISLSIGADQICDMYIRKNKPFILLDAGVENWRAWKEWRSTCDSGDDRVRPDFARLTELFGSADAPITNCKSGQVITLPICEFLTAWSKSEEGYAPPLRYLKDWHIARDFPRYEAYATPLPFKEDWLNDWWANPEGREAWAKQHKVPHEMNDYRFCYMGSAGTFTPLHHDVIYSFSWSASILGRKLWRIFPPSETKKLWHHKHKEMLVQDSREGHYDSNEYPNVVSARYVEVIQDPSEVIFVPSGYLHQVHNLDDCISINHNWLNGSNVALVWEYVKHKWEATEHVILHLKDSMEPSAFAEHVSKIMHYDIGVSPEEFCGMLQFWQRNLQMKKKCAHDSRPDSIQCDLDLLLGVIREVNHCWPDKHCPELLD